MALNDFVQTPSWVTEILLQHETFEGDIFEPCCGKGAISDVLKTKYNVVSSDKFDYGYGTIQDVYDIKSAPNIVTNTPFSEQKLLKKHLISIAKNKLCLLWYLKSLGLELESKTSNHLKSVYIVGKINWLEIKLGWRFAWYVWEKGYIGDVKVKRI